MPTSPGGASITNDDKATSNSSPNPNPFTTAMNGIESRSSIFSTSPSVHFYPPEVLKRLALDEDDSIIPSTSDPLATTSPNPSQPRRRRRTNGADKAALSSLLGWRPDANGSGFGCISTFLKHQCITVLYFSPVQLDDAGGSGREKDKDKEKEADREKAKTKDVEKDVLLRPTSPMPDFSTPFINTPFIGSAAAASLPPKRGQWRTYRFYDDREPTLGQWISDACDDVEVFSIRRGLLTTEVLDVTMEYTWMHLDMRVTARATIDSASETSDPEKSVESVEDDQVRLSMRCSVCGESTKIADLQDGAW